MSEQRKYRAWFGLERIRMADGTTDIRGAVEGRVTNQGVTTSTYKDKNGEDRTVARFTISVQNQESNFGYVFDVAADKVPTTASNDNKYVYVSVSVFGKMAENIEKYVHGGDVVIVSGKGQTREQNEKIFFNLTSNCPIKVVRRATGTPVGSDPEMPEEKPAAPAAAPQPSAPVKEEPTNVVDDNDEIDIDDEDLPF